MLTPSEDHFLDEVFASLKAFMNAKGAGPVVKVQTPEQLGNALPGLGEQAASPEALKAELQHILDNSVSTLHPLFLQPAQRL